MSARAVTLWFIDTADPATLLAHGVANDVTAAQRLASGIYGDSVLLPVIDTNLAAAMNADDNHVYAGHYGQLSVLSCSLLAGIKSAGLTRTVSSISPSAAATLLCTDPENGMGTFARWEEGQLRRAFYATPVDIFEDEGLPYPFERPFWAGDHPLQYAEGVSPDPLALPFHPQQLAEQSNREWLGFRFTHPLAPTDIDPIHIPVTGFAIHPADYVPTAEDLDRYRAASAQASLAPESVDARMAHSGVDQSDYAAAEPKPRSRLARYFGFGKS